MPPRVLAAAMAESPARPQEAAAVALPATTVRRAVAAMRRSDTSRRLPRRIAESVSERERATACKKEADEARLLALP